MSIVVFSWPELRELVLSGVCWGAGAKEHARCRVLDVLMSELEGFRFALFPVEATVPVDLIDGVSISLRAGDVAFLADCFNRRMSEPPSSPDGEDADNDILDILLPLRRKLQLLDPNLAKGMDYQLVVIGGQEE